MALAPGTRLGAYEVLSTLGAGGMGEVYKGRDTRLDRTVAIKVLREHLADNAGRRARFEREARAISKLNHPHICTLFDVGRENGTDYLVIEYLEGQTLADRLRKGALPIDQALTIAIDIADALDAAHRAGIIHRDLKPANVMLTKSGAKLLDFGIARMANTPAPTGATTSTTLTTEGALVGTVQYMAPEQLEGREADSRSDIFAFGAVLYELLSGKRAFAGDTTASITAAILERAPEPLSKTPAALDHLVQRALEKSPEDRWQTSRDLLKQLQWIASMPMIDETPSHQRITPTPRWGIGVAIVLVALVPVALAIARFIGNATTQDARSSRFEISVQEMPNPYQVSISPDGRRIAFVALKSPSTAFRSTSDTLTALFVRPIDAVDAQPLPGTEGALQPFWSPDSRHIGFYAQRKLKRIDVSGGPPQIICDAPEGVVGGTWNGEGIILFGGNATPLRRVPASGGVPTEVTTLDASHAQTSHYWPVFLPDGRHFFYMSQGFRPDSRAIYVGSLDDKKQTQVLSEFSQPLYASAGYLLFQRHGTLFAQSFDVQRLRLTGEPVRIAENIEHNEGNGRAAVEVSNTGDLVYRTSGSDLENGQLTWYDRRGTKVGTVGSAGVYRHFRLSPDNKRLAVHVHEEPGGGDVWVRDLERETLTKLTFDSHNHTPMWSQDGRFVYFTSDRGGINSLYRRASSGVGDDELVYKSSTSIYAEDVAPDDESVLFGAGTPRTSVDFWMLPLRGQRTPTPVLKTPAWEGLSKFSPNKRWIAYQSNESGSYEIYVMPFPQRTGKWQISSDSGIYVHWNRNGKELFYLRTDGTLMAVDVETEGPAFKAGTPHALFKTNHVFQLHAGSYHDPYDVTADGQRFLINERLSSSALTTPITVVLNWTAALKE